MTGKKIGYVRVSTIDQNPARQLENLELDKKFVDYASATTRERPQLLQMLDYVRDDDQIFVHSMDRLARTVIDLHGIVNEIIEKKASIHFIKENLVFTGNDNSISKLLLSVMGAVAEFESNFIRERQLEGVAIAKKQGKFKGRQKVMTPAKFELLNQLIKHRKSKTEIADELGVSRLTLYKALKQMGIYEQVVKKKIA